MDSKRISHIGLGLALAALAALLLYRLRSALTPIFAALLLAYLLNPVVNRIEKLRLNRSAAIFILAAATLLLIGGLVGFFLVQAQRELVALFANLPQYLAQTQERIDPLARQYLGRGIPASFEELLAEFKNRLSQVDPAALMPVSKAFGQIIAAISSRTWSLVSWVVGLLVIPVLLYYFLRDWDSLLAQAADLVPLRYRDYLLDKARQADMVLGAFLRGQLTVCVILGALYSLGLLLLGVDLAVVIGLAAGAAFIVPYLGTILGIVAASIMAWLEFGLGWHLVGVWVVFGAAQLLEGTVLTPRIVGKKVGLSPVFVILALLLGVNLLGFLGILIAVPLAAVLNVFLRDALARYRQSSFFLDPSSQK